MAKSLPAWPDRRRQDVIATARANALAVLCAEAIACHQAGQLGEAVAHYDRILALKPDLAPVHNNRGLALAELDRPERAVAAYRRAAALNADDPQTLCNWSLALAELGRWAEAEAILRRAIAGRPDFAAAHNNLGLILREQGRVAEAASALERAICLSPKDTSYYDNLAAIRPFTVGDPYVTALEALAADTSLPAVSRMHLDFALAKTYEPVGNSERAFAHLLAANAGKRAQIAYDEAATLAQMDRTREMFTRQFVGDRRGSGKRSSVPLFIVGMPRSGTTLIEQILASHPQIFGAGELNLLRQAADAIGGAAPQSPPFPEFVPGMSAAQLGELGTLYLEKLLQRAPGATRITDKMPANFLFAGLIHLALPDARIIHAVRDPIDTCVSCFSVHFTRGQLHTYDLAELGRYYRHYQALMAHWRRVLPPGRIIDVRYEDLVGDLEATARRLIACCGLPWDPRCLDFHRTERPVRTASALQVRQPLYHTSVGRWRRYERFLAPLLAELAPANGAIGSLMRKAG